MADLPPPSADCAFMDTTKRRKAAGIHRTVVNRPEKPCFVMNNNLQYNILGANASKNLANSSKLKQLLTKELREYSVNDGNLTGSIKSVLEGYISQFYDLSFKEVDLQITPFNSIKITFLAKDGNILSVHKPFDDQELKDDEFISSVRANNEKIFHGVMPIERIYHVFNRLALR